MLLGRIKKDIDTARRRKQSDRIDILTTFYAEAAMIGKNDGSRSSTDEEVIDVGRKFIKNIDIALAACKDINKTSKMDLEKFILNDYLPTMLKEADLRLAITTIIHSEKIDSPKQIGAVMKVLGKNYHGLYEGRMASAIVKELLT